MHGSLQRIIQKESMKRVSSLFRSVVRGRYKWHFGHSAVVHLVPNGDFDLRVLGIVWEIDVAHCDVLLEVWTVRSTCHFTDLHNNIEWEVALCVDLFSQFWMDDVAMCTCWRTGG